MSGGHWDYQQYRIMDIINDFKEDEYIREEFPELGKLVERVGDWLVAVIHDVDWHVSGDTIIENPAEFTREKLAELEDIIVNLDNGA